MHVGGDVYLKGQAIKGMDGSDLIYYLNEKVIKDNNKNPNVTGLTFEPIEEEGKSDERLLLESKANELEISFRENIGDKKLLEKIKEVEPNFEV